MAEKKGVPRRLAPSSNGAVVPKCAKRYGGRRGLVNRRVVVLTQKLRITPVLELRDVSLEEEEEPFERVDVDFGHAENSEEE